MTQASTADQSPGRPLDRKIDEAVLNAVRELLLESGYVGLSLTAIAQRAGTTRPALSRRWASLDHLVHEAAFPESLAAPREDADARPVRELVAGSLAAFADPVARAAAPGLVAAITADPSLHRRLLERFSLALGGIEQPLLDLVAGAALFALLLHPDDLDAEPTRSAWIDRITHLLTKGTS
ncbi:MAG TPA: helix-turn-helix domain-containing protein [Marmoricola sp.]|nr:helix-turn-helix domain-containing protein [Marmoricola sp.]